MVGLTTPFRLLALFGLASIVELATATVCAADDCARRVTGTSTLPGKPDVTSRLELCSSFFRITETPPPV